MGKGKKSRSNKQQNNQQAQGQGDMPNNQT